MLRHVSTHLLSHPQTLLNLRLFTVKYYMIARLRSHWLAMTVLKKLILTFLNTFYQFYSDSFCKPASSQTCYHIIFNCKQPKFN
jgi:hypothetical protein